MESRSFRERLEQALISYQNRSTRTAQIIAQLIEPREGDGRSRAGGARIWDFPPEELAFYDALETNDRAVQVQGCEQLRAIARELGEDGPSERHD